MRTLTTAASHRRCVDAGVEGRVETRAPAGALERETRPEENEVITAVALIRGIEGREEELEAHLLSFAAPTRAEPGLSEKRAFRHEVANFLLTSACLGLGGMVLDSVLAPAPAFVRTENSLIRTPA
jgi:hypothetical protein